MPGHFDDAPAPGAYAAQQHSGPHYRGRPASLLARWPAASTLISALPLALSLALGGVAGCSLPQDDTAADAAPSRGMPRAAPRTPATPSAAMLPEAPGALTGDLVNVQDGDSFRLRLPTGQAVRVRLAAIDAPELGQPHGEQARDALAALLRHGPLRLDAYKTDPFGRYVANVSTPEGDVGLAMVQAGDAWHFTRYAREQLPSDRQRYAQAQRDAQRARRGLWAEPRPVAPWDHRRQGRAEPRSASR